jgi:hypothetical protein
MKIEKHINRYKFIVTKVLLPHAYVTLAEFGYPV